MSASQRNVLVGVVVLVGLGMLAWMVLQFANKAATFFLTSGMKITLTAPRAEGVADGSPVTYRGVNVGRVTGVRLGEREEVVIDALIQNGAQIPANVHGRIKQTSLLGASATIALEPVELPPASRSEAAPMLTEGANLPADYVPDITSLGDDIRVLSGSMDKLIQSVNDVIGDPKVKEDIKLSLKNARETLESANRIAVKLEQVSANIDKQSANAGETISEVRVTVKDARGEIKKISDNLNQRLQQVAESLQHFQSIIQKVDQGKGTAGQLVNDPKLYDSMADTAAELNLMVKDMRRLVQQWEQEGIVKF
jgi:phospholipid/cholesterol/gamma-HCH transport system substrate-binding protein